MEVGTAGAASTPQALGPGCTSHTYGGKDYLFCPDVQTWDAARTECQSVAMELVRIEDSAARDLVLF